MEVIPESSLEARDCAKALGRSCEEREIFTLARRSPVVNPIAAAVSPRYERSSSSSLGGRNSCLPLFVFGRVLLPGDSFGLGGYFEAKEGEAQTPLCIVDVDGKE